MQAVKSSNARCGDAGTVTVFRTGSIDVGWSVIGRHLLPADGGRSIRRDAWRMHHVLYSAVNRPLRSLTDPVSILHNCWIAMKSLQHQRSKIIIAWTCDLLVCVGFSLRSSNCAGWTRG